MIIRQIASFIIHNILSLQFSKYIIAGISNALFSTLVYLFCLKILVLHYILSFTISWLFGVLFTYIINFMFIFKPDEKLEFRRRLPKYFMVYLTSYLLNIVLLKFLVHWTHFDPFYLQLLILPLVIAINFTGFKYWALK
jgi:putative flippase GtrA